MHIIFFDASRLFIRGSRFSPTGIDRVVLAYARWLLNRSDVDLRPVVTAQGQIWEAPASLLADIVAGAELFRAASRNGTDPGETWRALVEALRGSSDTVPLRAKSVAWQLPRRVLWHARIFGRSLRRLRPAKTPAGSSYLNVSHTGLGDPHVLSRLKAKGVRNVILLHDLIPIEHPEYCAPGAYDRHVRRMENVLASTDLVIANSQTTADSLLTYAKKMHLPCPQTVVARLGIEPDFLDPPPPLRVATPYFICVGTLEARKNLTFLLALWRRLDEQFGFDAPRLVLVGRRGWENESVLDHLQRSDAALRLVYEVSDLPDPQLASLVAGARALLAPSFTEGFDLPVMEALSLGTPVIASDIPVHRELSTGATLLDPLDGPGWFEAIRDAIQIGEPAQNPAFRAPRWEDHFAAIETPLLRD
jgi:glycosyltransferase involved in cell wall biosynthesis